MVSRSDTSRPAGTDWLMRAVTAGFLATVLMTLVLLIGFWVAALLGSASGQAPFIQRWLWALANNVVTNEVQTALPLAILVHFLAGIGWALVYALVAEPRLAGPAWQRGMLFSLVPWALSLVVFLPLVGGGLLGLALGAGPLPIVGNLILHLVYGATLGQLYLAESDVPVGGRGELESATELSTLARAGRTMAAGIIIGLVFGALIGVLAGLVLTPTIGVLPMLAIGAIMGGMIGALIGSFWGLSPQGD
jgi:hypothetical protein